MLSTLAAVRPKKRLFLGLLLVTEFLVALALYGLWRISYLGLENISEYLPAIVGALLIFVSTFSFGAVCNMVLAYNPEMVDEWAAKGVTIPQSFDAFANDPALKGYISMGNPMSSGTTFFSCFCREICSSGCTASVQSMTGCGAM